MVGYERQSPYIVRIGKDLSDEFRTSEEYILLLVHDFIKRQYTDYVPYEVIENYIRQEGWSTTRLDEVLEKIKVKPFKGSFVRGYGWPTDTLWEPAPGRYQLTRFNPEDGGIINPIIECYHCHTGTTGLEIADEENGWEDEPYLRKENILECKTCEAKFRQRFLPEYQILEERQENLVIEFVKNTICCSECQTPIELEMGHWENLYNPAIPDDEQYVYNPYDRMVVDAICTKCKKKGKVMFASNELEDIREEDK